MTQSMNKMKFERSKSAAFVDSKNPDKDLAESASATKEAGAVLPDSDDAGGAIIAIALSCIPTSQSTMYCAANFHSPISFVSMSPLPQIQAMQQTSL